MYEEVMRQIEKAIESSEQWAVTGWSAAFGSRQVVVGNLKDAEALPRNAVYRLEAINYWKQVEQTGHDAAEAGRKALDALRNGDECTAADALYFSQYVEKPIAVFSNTWGPLYEEFCSSLCN